MAAGSEMAVTVDTAGVSTRERLAYWSEAQTRMFFALDVRAREDRPFGGRAWEHELGPVRVRRIAADGHGVRRTRRAIAADDPEQFELSLLLAGTQELHQADRDAVLGPGDLVCMDSSRPYRVSSPDAFEMLVFAVPKVLLRPHVDVVGARTASAIPARAGLAALVAPFLRSVGDGLLDGTVSEDDADLGEGVVDLVRGLFAQRDGGRRGDLLADVKATIELRLHDPGLRPTTVAAAHYISTRYLHRLFEPEGVTVSEWVRMRRLEHCRRDLEDPALADETVLAIASRWGLRNPGHFSRLFHAAYGMSPSAVRGRASARR
jgi:AraC-like DNA-binding protein